MKIIVCTICILLLLFGGAFFVLKALEGKHLSRFSAAFGEAAASDRSTDGLAVEARELAAAHRFEVVERTVRRYRDGNRRMASCVVHSRWLPVDLGYQSVRVCYGVVDAPSEPVARPVYRTSSRGDRWGGSSNRWGGLSADHDHHFKTPARPSASAPTEDTVVESDGLCSRCGGKGQIKSITGWVNCGKCRGTGNRRVVLSPPGGDTGNTRKCYKCNGYGTRGTVNGYVTCPCCDGEGWITREYDQTEAGERRDAVAR